MNVETARRQHSSYVQHLRDHCANVHLLPEQALFPDSVFVEDAAVVLGSVAIHGTAGHKSRQGEASLLTPTLQQIGLHVQRIDARLDGGDVLQMHAHVLVGLSERTTERAVDELQRFTKDKVCPIHVKGGLHLKSLITWIDGVQMFVAADTHSARYVMSQIREQTQCDYDVIWLHPEDANAANVLDLQSAVLVQQRFPRAVRTVRDMVQSRDTSISVSPCDMSELAKANGALTCCSILVGSSLN